MQFYALGGLVLDFPLKFNAVHMSLIPKGPYQGMVLVWNAFPVLANPPTNPPYNVPALPPGQFWPYQAYAIVDPSSNPAGPRFRNFLLPFGSPVTPSTPTVPPHTFDLFCSGHTWSPFGDLIVVGGTEFTTNYFGARLTYALNPQLQTGRFPGTNSQFYSDFGLWVQGPNLADGRFYPTAILTNRLSRLNPLPAETVIVAGGSIDDLSSDPNVNTTWNNYESLVVNGPASTTGCGFVTENFSNTPPNPRFPGPGFVAPDDDWFGEYPRLHLLSSGWVLMSGYGQTTSFLNPNNPGSWARLLSPGSSNWTHPRHDGASFLFPNLGGLADIVVRIGGCDASEFDASPLGSTPTAEFCVGTTQSWQSAPSLLNGPNGRYLQNAVLLPDASVVVIGGLSRAPGSPAPGNPGYTPGSPVYAPDLFRNNAWTSLPANPVSGGSTRDYHSTAVLLPDGRVFIGGGEQRNFDYEILSPPYLTSGFKIPMNIAFTPNVLINTAYDAFGLSYNTSFTVTCDALPLGIVLQKAVLMAPGSTTHHSDFCQRYLEMPVTQQGPNKITFTTPLDDVHATRGIYMLFLVTNQGAPSNAIWVCFP
jgi:hypothetical protein